MLVRAAESFRYKANSELKVRYLKGKQITGKNVFFNRSFVFFKIEKVICS